MTIAPQNPGITARDLLESPVKRTLQKRQKREQEANQPPQMIRQISHWHQDQQPSKNIQQNDPQAALLFPMTGVGMAVGMGFENHRTEHGRQRQGHQTGENDGRGHGDAELAVEGADRPGNESHRNENGCHHQRDGDDRAGDLVQHLHRRPIGTKMLCGHLGVHRLNHHDRIVHHDPDRQHHREERDQVDGETEQLQENKGSDQRHRNRQGRDQRGS